VDMKKVFAMAVIFGVAAAFMAGCGEEPKPAAPVGNLKKSAEKTSADASKGLNKAAADAKKAANDATK